MEICEKRTAHPSTALSRMVKINCQCPVADEKAGFILFLIIILAAKFNILLSQASWNSNFKTGTIMLL